VRSTASALFVLTARDAAVPHEQASHNEPYDMNAEALSVRTFVGPGLAGGPTAVFLLPHGLTDDFMLSMARKADVAVTAFLFPSDRADAGYAIRY
jgi:hypothetical protein